MKRLFKAGIAMVLAGFLTVSGMGFTNTVMAAEATNKLITVNGSGVIKVDPDKATINLGVETTGSDAVTAQKETAVTMNKVISALKAMGINESQITTSRYSVYPDYNYNRDTGEETIKGYKASNVIKVTTNDVDGTGAIIDTAAKAGANVNNGVSFSVEDSSKYYGEALALAVKSADTSAKSISEALSVTLGAPISVTESGGSSVFSKNLAMSARGAVEDSATNISYEQIEITASVTVQYEY